VNEFALDNDGSKKYLKDKNNIIYDIASYEPIGVYDPDKKEIVFNN